MSIYSIVIEYLTDKLEREPTETEVVEMMNRVYTIKGQTELMEWQVEKAREHAGFPKKKISEAREDQNVRR